MKKQTAKLLKAEATEENPGTTRIGDVLDKAKALGIEMNIPAPEEILSNRCSGHCCECFYLPFSPQQLKKKLKDANKELEKYKQGKATFDDVDKDIKWLREVMDNIEIFSMAKFVKVVDKNETLEFKNFQPEFNIKEDELYHYYTCKHYDKKTGNCGNYEDRPYMCRTFPNTTFQNKDDGTIVRYCEYKNCTCKNWNYEHLKKTGKIRI